MQLAEIQARLAVAGLDPGPADGEHGPRTTAAIEALFLARPVVRGDWRSWDPERRAVAAAQLFCMLDDIEVGAIDGLIGPQTRHAFEVYEARRRGIDGVETWRDHGMAPVSMPAGATVWPRQTEAEMIRFFGPVGANQATLEVPPGYPLRLAWDPARPVARFSCHERVRDPVRRVLGRALDHYGPARLRELGLDLFGGSLNVRRMRGGSAWSVHAWGAAFDFDPERNQLRWDKRRARLARPEYGAWWRFWEDEGFVSLGRACDFDWMHVQAARL